MFRIRHEILAIFLTYFCTNAFADDAKNLFQDWAAGLNENRQLKDLPAPDVHKLNENNEIWIFKGHHGIPDNVAVAQKDNGLWKVDYLGVFPCLTVTVARNSGQFEYAESCPGAWYQGQDPLDSIVRKFKIEKDKFELGKATSVCRDRFRELCEYKKQLKQGTVRGALAKDSKNLTGALPYKIMSQEANYTHDYRANFPSWGETEGLDPWLVSDIILYAAKSGSKKNCAESVLLKQDIIESDWTPSVRKAVSFNEKLCAKVNGI